ncbi:MULTISPECIES: ABC transporter substrate-binding protein [Romboutsia]|uniref:Nitrogenase cofactor biosynthesis protein NifB n=1 Tax=Romboutsia hominis TaxID=1507512 RepID=A0A2P2BMX9_9FIRM|nr:MULTISPECIES: aliphatic sulfonate ABC transporter substrate-binding protein [Romboutsia]MCH1958574.1 aliphatic sulfonate ABC transporter substrate-binding protein [Romboutsia hominis]MCH1970492.1 aliphatic sulfonate ABC transporter substrate-binding protein [Romboutsia hominis]MDB8789175.1 aliphatic sulfonate ABC transporter substrate-binding protein [Romboutsia sp. 1001216sp1]MDB8793184.1 aliphatic sulfonate ABC transporter substrate-binding protein [Romboutsia sp. 1001216sp1]MDB8795976.1 
MKLSKSIKIKLTSVLATGVLMISMVGCTTTKEASLDKLVITHVTSPLNVPSIIQKNKNVFANEFSENGKDIAIEYAEITSGADQTQALASGDVDILYAVGGTSVVSAAANGADIKILNMYSRSPEAFCMYSLDENIKSAQDLKGKTIAGPVGTNLHQLLIAYLEKAGMTIDDVNYVNMSIADAKAALDGKSVDAALVAGPTAYKAEQQGYNLVTNGKGLTDAVIAVAVREDFYNEHKEEVELFMKAQENVNKYMNENYDETMEIVSKELDLDKSAVEEMYKQYDFSIETTDADRKAFQNVADFMLKTGMIEEEVKTNELFIK